MSRTRSSAAWVAGGGLVLAGLVIGLLLLLRAPAPAPQVAARADAAAGAVAVAPRPAPPPVLRAAPAAPDRNADAAIAELGPEPTPAGRQLDHRFAAETRDAAWAPVAEQNIKDALSAEALGSGFTPPTVECRATLCEIRASSTVDPVAPGNDLLERWQTALARLDQRKENGLETIGTLFTTGDSGRVE